ncbi:MAG TPA: NADH-quinone oxidoreductase subunit J [Acidimicrobiia bacterium]|jgi:NADH-quinone oxidoreductase subunit J
MEWAVFVVFAVAALAGAGGVVLSRKPVHSALSLVLTLFSVAVFFVLQGAHFLAAVQVIVYAGAVVILFLFVIMLLGIDQDDVLDEPLAGQRPLAVIVGVALFAGLLLVAGILTPTGAPASRGSATQGDVANVERIARSLFTDFLWPFEITSALLVIAVVGAIVLARQSGPGRPLDEEEHVGAGSDEGPAALLEQES